MSRPHSVIKVKLDPTLRMDVMSLCIVCLAGLKSARHCQFTGKYAHDYKEHSVEMLACIKRHGMMSRPFSKWDKVLVSLVLVFFD